MDITQITCEGKQAWPELVGERAQEAAVIIETENPHVRAIIIPKGCPVPLDFRCDRVFVAIDCGGRVVTTPSVH